MTRSPVSELHLSLEGKEVLAEREGMALEAYRDSVGVWTIGIGHTAASGLPEPAEGMVITEAEAWLIFEMDNARFREEVLPLVTVPLEQWEFDALASFIFNIGTTQFSGSTVLKELNAGDYPGAGEAMLMWDIPPEIIPRRRGEYVEFTDAEYVARVSDEDWETGVLT